MPELKEGNTTQTLPHRHCLPAGVPAAGSSSGQRPCVCGVCIRVSRVSLTVILFVPCKGYRQARFALVAWEALVFRVPGCRHVPQHGYASHFRAIRLHEHPSPPADALRPAVADLPAPPNSWLLLNPCKRPPRRRSPAVICRILLACRGVEQTHETGLCLPKPG